MEIKTRDLRQNISANTWNNTKCGTIIAPTGFGKTKVATIAIDKLIDLGVITGTNDVLIIVPLIELKNQWERVLKNEGLDKYSQVVVVNTACKNIYHCKFMIVDEIHRLGAPEFSKILNNVSYQYILGLTATLERTDGKHHLITQYCPIVDRIDIDECVKNGWVSPFVVYNLAVNFTDDEYKAYKVADSLFKYATMRCGYGKFAFQNAQEWLKSGTPQQKSYAGMYFNSMKKRKQIILNSKNKILITKQILDKFPDRISVVFNETIDSARKISDLVGEESVLFHSKMTKTDREKALKLFKDRSTNKRVLSSVKSLQEGFDYPYCSLGIIVSGTSIKRSAIQSVGRIIRYVEGKRAIIVNLFIPNSQDFYWVKNRTKDQNPVWITDVDEIV